MKKNIIALVIGMALAFCMGFGICYIENHANTNPSNIDAMEHILVENEIEYDSIVIESCCGEHPEHDLSFAAYEDGKCVFRYCGTMDNYTVIWE